MTEPKVHTFTGGPVGGRSGMPRALVILLGIAAAVVTVAGIKATAWFFGPVLLALVIVIAVAPVYRRLRAHRVPAWAATVAFIVVVYGVIVGFSLTVTVSLARLATLLPQYSHRFDELLNGITDRLTRFGVGAEQVRAIVRSVDFGKVVSSLGSVLAGVAGLVTNVVFLLALLFFLSIEATGFDERMAAVTTERPSAGAALNQFAGNTRRYLVVSTVFGLIVAALDTVALALLGIPLALLWGLLSFVTNYIPNVGFILGLLPPALLALLSGRWQTMLIVIAVYCLFNFVVQSLIQPYYVGDAVGLSAVLTFLALIFWSWVFGPLGMILAIPVTLLVKTILVDADPDAGWFATLLHLSAGDSAGKNRRPRGDGPRAKGRTTLAPPRERADDH
jgi:AI-2 transport protein TqsA